ncbi:hypothetical protein ACS0TY_035053 [Phlomoides rotata]
MLLRNIVRLCNSRRWVPTQFDGCISSVDSFLTEEDGRLPHKLMLLHFWIFRTNSNSTDQLGYFITAEEQHFHNRSLADLDLFQNSGHCVLAFLLISASD